MGLLKSSFGHCIQWKGLLSLALPPLLAIGLAGCRKPAPAAVTPPKPEVTYVTVRPETLPVNFNFIGQTDASQSVEIRARVQGFLLDWRKNFTEGGVVEDGKTLFQIDPREFQVALDEAKANTARAEARAQRADREVKRLTEAVATRAASERELDDAITEQLQAQADVRLQRATYEARNLQYGYTTIKSPLKGVIGRAQKDVGSLVDGNQNSLLATVLQLDPMYAYFSFSEREYVNFRQDVEAGRLIPTAGEQAYVEVSLIDGTPYPYSGAVNFSDVSIDIRTGSAKLRASLHNPSFVGPRETVYFLKPGQFLKGSLVGWVRPNTIAVPQVSVVQGAAGAFVYVLDSVDKAEMRAVTLGNWTGDDWIITSGLEAGDRVVVGGVAKVGPNVEVTATEMAPATRPTTRQAKPTSGPATGPMTQPLRPEAIRPTTMPSTNPI